MRNLPDDVDDEDVADFFEHRKRGGFTVDRVELDQATASALVYFQEEEGQFFCGHPLTSEMILNNSSHIPVLLSKMEAKVGLYRHPLVKNELFLET